jgi:hypothetical protein
MGERTRVGKFIHTTWTNLNIRCGKYKHLQTREKCKHYDKIKIGFSQPEFKSWCWENKDLIENLNRPSLDRIDSKLNYTLENIQIIELAENIRKDKTVFFDGKGRCYVCKNIKLEEEFDVDKRRFNGRTSRCKECRRSQRRVSTD